MSESILNSVKKVIGFSEEYEEFDMDLILLINADFAFSNQLGIGPEKGFRIDDKTKTWEDFTGGDIRLNCIMDYIFARVKLQFDQTYNSYNISSLRELVKEAEFRMLVAAEELKNNG